MRERVIFDLDNCISDDGWRIDKIDWSKSVEEGRYDAYHAAASEDKPGNLGILRHHVYLGRELVFLTARPVAFYRATCEWLARHLGLDDTSTYTLLMREPGDHRPSVELKRAMLDILHHYNLPIQSIVAAYDDRPDVVEMYAAAGIPGARQLWVHKLDAYAPPSKAQQERDAQAFGIIHQEITMQESAQPTAADILAEAAETFRQRNAVYGSNYQMVGPIMKILFPQGVDAELLSSNQFHLFELVIVKLSRLAISRLAHVDSAHDAAVYCAMIEMCMNKGEKQ